MRNILKANFIMLIAALFFTACQKEETPEVFDTISGVLSAGENVNTEDLNGLKIYLGRFHDSVDFSSITLKTTAIDSVGVTSLNADGSFTFSGLTSGNYGLVLQDGFIITGDTALTFQFNALEQQNITQTIDRIPQNNFTGNPGSTTPILTFKRDNLSSTYKVKKLNCYNNNKLHSSYVVPEFNKNSINDWTLETVIGPPAVTFELEFWKDNDETKKFTSVKIPYYYSNNSSNHGPWEGDLIDIAWVPYSSTTTWQFSWPVMKIREIKGHYVLSNHN